MTLLVDSALYARVTGDTDAYGPGMADLFNDAQTLVEEHCNRTFRYGTYTERVYVYGNGLAYPKATPIASIASPANSVIQGNGVWIGPFFLFPFSGFVWGYGPDAMPSRQAFPLQADLTYTGGYQPYGTTGPTPALPAKLAYAICQVAYNIRHTSELPNVPYGATSVHVGDVGYSGNLEPASPLDSSIQIRLKGFVRHPVRGWQ